MPGVLLNMVGHSSSTLRLSLAIVLALILALALVLAAFLSTADPGGPVNAQVSGGPVVLMGIDAEDGGPGGHGPLAVYVNVVSSISADVTNGGSGILVIGGGKDTTPPVDDVTEF